MLNKQNNVYKLVVNENEHNVKFIENKESKDNIEVFIDSRDLSFKGLKEFRLFINFLTDVCEDLEEKIGE